MYRLARSAVLLLTLALAAPASAISTTYTLTGTVDTVFNNTGQTLPFAPGSSYSLTMVVDQTAPDVTADPTAGDYFAITSYSLTLGSFSASGAPPDLNLVAVNNADSSPPNDRWLAVIRDDSETLSLPGFLGRPNQWQLAILQDDTGTAFSDDSLQVITDLAPFSTTRFGFSWFQLIDGVQTNVNLGGNLESISATVPEPGTALLMGAAVFFVARRRS